MAKGYKPAEPVADGRLLRKFAEAGLDGADWYDRGQDQIADLCNREGWSVKRFTDTLAILSPQVSVRRNIRLAIQYNATGRLLSNVMGGVRRSLDVYNATGKVSGPKVSKFAAALQGDRSAIVLDTWMARALLVAELDPSLAKLRRVATRELACKRIKAVAKRLNLCPRDCQAAIWAGIIREFNGNPARLDIAGEYETWLAYGREFPATGDIVADPHYSGATSDGNVF